ncbi:mediator of DNA damage checkpoint protein 1 isoform X2 [Parambassis ranga]|uniref:Mediator of DNA damage checkpoint protein 1 n=1 Tax=Parambassis ranga TaxID=210632 RepID=A0A6P7JTG1_9TELE|nr:mediator of DNA damage checkpoint protein 1 isoform X2 [Parambassis ranga]
MDATQMIDDSVLESDDEENDEENENNRGRPLAKLCILRNEHIPQTELPLFLGDNVLGRDPNTCTLPLSASSVSKQHATICISVYRRRGCLSKVDVEALVWDLGSMNGTRKGRLKLTPNVRYALSEGDSLVLADIPCQYFSYNVDSSQGDTWTPVSRKSGVKAKLPDASREKEGDITYSKKCVNGGAEDKGPLKKTPAKASCLSFEQTPTQPQGTLVPESDSGSDSENSEAEDRRRKALASDSDSFLSPTNKIVPESEDESSVTPSSFTKNKPYKGFNFSTKETDVNVGRQQPNTTTALAVVDDSEEEEEGEAQGGIKSKESGQHVPVKQESTVSFTREDELPASKPMAFKDVIPALSMDSDTDLEEGEERVVSSGPVTLTTNQKYDRPPNTVQFHMDSDTEEDEDVSGKTSSKEKHSSVISVIQPKGITMDSDTDVDDADAAASDATSKTKPTPPTDTAASIQLKDFHLDSDTDVDDEEDEECGTKNFETDETPNKLDIQTAVPQSIPTAPQNLNSDSDTDDEAIPAPAINKLPVVAPSCTNAIAGADLCILSDSDTDVEGNSSLIMPVAGTSLSVSPRPEALHSDSDAATDIDESIMPPAGANPAHPKVDGETVVDDKTGGGEEAGEDAEIPTLQREFTPGLPAPFLQNCSTPVQIQEVEGMETQTFISPSSDAFRCAVASAVRPAVLSSCSESQDEDFVVAETQSFVLQSRDRLSSMEPTQAFVVDSSGDKKDEQSCREESFQLGLSDSSHLQCQDQAVAMESTQAFVSVGKSLNLDDTQVYAAITAADTTSVGNDLSPEPMQPYEENEKPARCAVEPERVDMALEATQAYLSDSLNDQEDNTDEDRQNAATTETGISSTLAMAETQQMFTGVNRESDDDDDSFPGPQKRTTEPLKLEEEQTQPMLVGVDETQPMAISEDDDSDVTDLVPRPRKRKSKQLHLEDEETPQLLNSEISVAETQPMSACEDNDEDEDSMPCIRNRKAKQLQFEEEQTQPLVSSEVSAVETQPFVTDEHEESGEDDTGKETALQPKKRKGRSFATFTEEKGSVPPKRRTQVESKTLPSIRGRRRRARPDDDDNDNSEEDVKQNNRARGKRTLKQQKIDERKGKQEEMERKEKEEQERLQAENAERMRLEEERIETERKAQELLKTAKREQEEKLKRERMEKEERERQEHEKLEREEKERLEREEKERLEREEKQRLEREEKERLEREEKQRLEREEKERLEREENERLEKEEKERLEREEIRKLEMERKEQEEKEQLEMAKREQEERLEKERKEKEKERLEREAKEREERENLEKERENKEEENKSKAPARGRRTNRRTIAAPCAPEPDSTNDDFPARRTRSRSNSSNSVSSEVSASSVSTLESTGRGRGRGAKRISAPPQTTATRSSRRRTAVAAGPPEQDGDEFSPLSRSNSSNSLNSEISSCSVSSQSRGRGGRQRGRGRKTEPNPDSVPPQSDAAPKPVVRNTKSRKTEGFSSEALQKDERVTPDSQQASTTRGRRQANTNVSVPAEEEDRVKQKDGCAGEESLVPKGNARGKGQKENSETAEEPVDGESPQDKRKGSKGEFQANTEVHSSCGSSISKGKEKTPKTEPGKEETNDDSPAIVQAQRQGRASSIRLKKSAKESSTQEVKESEKMEVELTEKRARGRSSVVPKKKKKEELEDSGSSTTSMNQDANVQASQLRQTPTSGASRKRQAPAESFLVAKSPRSSSASPATSGRLQAAGQTYKVLFTGVVDEAGERVLTRLGGSMAKDVADMNCLVTDKVRRTVKFLCAVAKGVPIVTTDWLVKSGKAGSFLSPNAFLVKDPEQEGKFKFCLQESLRIASSQLLLQGYKIHVTKSVKPEPVQMKDIISTSGATFLPKMPSSHKPQTLVISCEEDWLQCGLAKSASIPVVTAEFILTGILQQKIDFETHKLSPPAAKLQPAVGSGRSRKKT